MTEFSSIGLLTAFLAGIVSFLSPCVLPLVPGYVSFIGGRTLIDHGRGQRAVLRLPSIGLSLCFVLGFSIVFILLGASATALGQLLLAYRYELNIIGGIVVIGFGLLLIGVPGPSWLSRDLRFHAAIPGGRPASAFLLGLAFGFGWTPCIGPILGAILTVSAATTTIGGGLVLLATYSLGLGLPFLLAALFTDGLAVRLRAIGRVGRALQIVAGATLVLMGVAMLTGQLAAFSYWLLEAFPALAQIG